MKTSSILSVALAAVSTLAAGVASAAIINSSYYPPGEDFVDHGSVANRAEVKAQIRELNHQIKFREPRREFGAGSHDTSPEVFTRSEVKAGARDYTRTGSHVPFQY